MGQDARTIDSWGRYITAFSLQYKMVQGKTFTYVPKGDFQFMVKGPQSDDRALVQYLLNSKPVGELLKCSASPQSNIDSEYTWVTATGCMLDIDKFGVTEAGTWTVKVGYRQTSAGIDHNDLAEYKFEVKPHTGAAGGKEFHIDSDFRMGESWLHLKQNGANIELFTWFKVNKDQKTGVYPGQIKMRCFIDGKTMEMDDTTNSRFDYEYDDYTTKGGNAEKSHWQFNYFFPPMDAQAFFKSNPGNYICKITRNGELDRELLFTIGPDGLPVKPACQQGEKPLVSSPTSTTLIKTVMTPPPGCTFRRQGLRA